MSTVPHTGQLPDLGDLLSNIASMACLLLAPVVDLNSVALVMFSAASCRRRCYLQRCTNVPNMYSVQADRSARSATHDGATWTFLSGDWA